MQAKAVQTAAVAAAVPVPGAAAEIVTFRPPLRPTVERVSEAAGKFGAAVIPPVIVIGLILFVWQLLCSAPGSSLPAPSKVIADSWDFIVDPFYDNGGVDKGAFWHIAKSLSRVAVGYSLAAIVGVALGVLVG